MGRTLRIAEGGFVYHVLNRGNGRRAFLNKAGDFAAFERILGEAKQEVPLRILAYCLLPNHWHLLLWPQEGSDLSRFVGWLTLTHAQTLARPLPQCRQRPFVPGPVQVLSGPGG